MRAEPTNCYPQVQVEEILQHPGRSEGDGHHSGRHRRDGEEEQEARVKLFEKRKK